MSATPSSAESPVAPAPVHQLEVPQLSTHPSGVGERASRTPSATTSRSLVFTTLLFADVLSAFAAFFLAWYARYHLQLGGDVAAVNYVDFSTYLPLMIGFAATLVAILYFKSMYRLPRAQALTDEFIAITSSAALGTMTLYAVTTFFQYPAESRATFVYAWLLATFAITLGRAANRALHGWLHQRGIGVERVLVVGESNVGRMIMQGLAAQPHLGYQVVGFVGDSGDSDFGRFRCLGRIQNIDQVIVHHEIDQVLIALPSASHESILRIVDHCRRDNLRFKLVPDLYEMRLSQLDVQPVYGIPLIGMKDTNIRGWNLLVKRMLDVTISVLGLAVASLPMLVIALLIKLDSPGPVLYRQVRVGRGARPFVIYKFRSMRDWAEQEQAALRSLSITAGPTFKVPDDPRITRVGRVLRHTSLDELPQLWNVLNGDMSLVGPRPPTPDEVALYEDWHRQRLEVSPGITGIWQVSGRSSLTFDEQVVLDVYYIENWSLGLDLSILLRTIPAVISGGGAF